METAQSVALGLLTLFAVRTYIKTKRDHHLALAFVASGLAMATRPCHVISYFSFIAVLLVHRFVS